MSKNKKHEVNAKLWSSIGLCMRAGKCISGEELVLKAVRSGKAELVIVASDASANTVKKFQDKCRFYKVDFLQIGTREEIGRSIGKRDRVVIAITDSGFAEMIRKHSENLSEVKDIE